MRGRGRPKHPDILTPRQWEVLALLRKGGSNEEIAQALGVTLATARFHVSEIIGKLGVANRHEAAAWQPEPTSSRPAWARLLVPFASVRQIKLSSVGSVLSVAVVAGVIALVALLVWGVTRTAAPPASSSDVSHFCTPGPTSTPYPKTRIPPTLAPANRPPPVTTEGIETRVAWTNGFVAAGCDPRALPTAGGGSIDIGRHQQTLGDAIAGANIIIIGHVTATVFKADFADVPLPQAYETIAIERTLKGAVSGEITVWQEGGPVPDNGGMLLTMPGDDVLLPGDEVLLLGIVNSTSRRGYVSEYPVGKFRIRSGKMYALAGNPCNTMDGLAISDVINSIVAAVDGQFADSYISANCDWSRGPR